MKLTLSPELQSRLQQGGPTKAALLGCQTKDHVLVLDFLSLNRGDLGLLHPGVLCAVGDGGSGSFGAT